MKDRRLILLAGRMKVIPCGMQQVFDLSVVQAALMAVLRLERLVSALSYALQQGLFLQAAFVKTNMSVHPCDFVRDSCSQYNESSSKSSTAISRSRSLPSPDRILPGTLWIIPITSNFWNRLTSLVRAYGLTSARDQARSRWP